MTPCPSHAQPLLLSTSPPKCTFDIIYESTLTHHYHPEPIVYIRVHSWCTFYGFGQRYKICIHYYGIIQNFTALKVFCAQLFILHLPTPTTSDIFLTECYYTCCITCLSKFAICMVDSFESQSHLLIS